MTDDESPPRSPTVGPARPGRSLPTVAAVLTALLAVPGTALAHGGGTGIHGSWLPIAVFVLGAVVLGASVYLDARESIDRSVADAGVVLGVACVIGAIGIYWL